eukprot:g4020.t1
MLSIDLKSNLFKERKFIRVCRRNSVSEIAQMLNVFPPILKLQPVELRFGDKIVSETNLSSCDEFFGNDRSNISIAILRKENEQSKKVLKKVSKIEIPSFRKIQNLGSYDSKISYEFWKRRNEGFIVTEKVKTVDTTSSTGRIASCMLIPDNLCPSWGLEQSQDEEWYEIERIVGFRASGIRSPTHKKRRKRTRRKSNNNDYSHFLVKWQGYKELTWEPTENLHPRTIRNFLLEVSRDVAESRRTLVGERVLKSNESNVATCIGVCRCGRFDGKFHAIVRQYDDAQSVSRSNKKKKKRSYCFTYRTECVHFDSLISLSSTTTSSSSKMMCIAC